MSKTVMVSQSSVSLRYFEHDPDIAETAMINDNDTKVLPSHTNKADCALQQSIGVMCVGIENKIKVNQ